MKRLIGDWTVYTYHDGEFKHARHRDPSVLIVWTLAEFQVADPLASAEYHLTLEPSR